MSLRVVQKCVIILNMTEQEAWELDELLTKTTPEVSATVEGHFIKHRNMMVVLDQFSMQYLTAEMYAQQKDMSGADGLRVRQNNRWKFPARTDSE